MTRTAAEEDARGIIIRKALHDAATWLEENGVEPLTPEQTAEVHQRLQQAVDEMRAHVETEALDLLTCAATFQIVGEVVGIIQRSDLEPVAVGLELAEVGARAASVAVASGGYPSFSEDQRGQIIRAIRRKVETVLRDRVPVQAARESVADFARVAVDLVMGEAPARRHMN
jgi:hypothetical protein